MLAMEEVVELLQHKLVANKQIILFKESIDSFLYNKVVIVMKEAAVVANMTAITIVLIGVVAAVGAILISRILTSLYKKSCCTESGGYWYQSACYTATSCTVNSSNKVTSCNNSGKFSPSC